ncbi:MAG TPA: hypothetical protein VIQ62_05040, partial [Burkholderiales bacterium]
RDLAHRCAVADEPLIWSGTTPGNAFATAGHLLALCVETVCAQTRPDHGIRFICRLGEEGADIQTTTPQQLAAFVGAGIEKWAKAVKISGAKLD